MDCNLSEGARPFFADAPLRLGWDCTPLTKGLYLFFKAWCHRHPHSLSFFNF